MSPSFTMTFASNAVVATETTTATTAAAAATDTALAAARSASVNGSDGLGGCNGGGGGLANGRTLKKLASCSDEGEGDSLLSGKMQKRQV